MKKQNGHYMAFPLSPELKVKIDRLIAGVRNAAPRDNAELLTEIGMDLTNEALGHYLVRSLDRMNISALLKKIAMVAVHATRKAMHPVMKKICHKLDDDQMRAAADILEELQIEK